IVRVRNAAGETLATINRGGRWDAVGAPLEAPDHSVAVISANFGTVLDSVVVPLEGRPPTLHDGLFAGFTATAAIAASTASHSSTPGEPLPALDRPYSLPSIEELVAGQSQPGDGQRVVAKGLHDAVLGDTATHRYEVPRDEVGGGSVFFDC